MFGGQYEKKDMEFKPIPKGRYSCILDNCCIDKTPDKPEKKGTSYLKMDFTIVTGPMTNRKLWHKVWFTEKSYDMAAQQLDNMGVFNDIKKSSTIDDFMLGAAEAVFKLVGEKLTVAVTGHNTYNDKTYENCFVVTGEEAVVTAVATSADVSTSEEIPF